MNKFIIAILFVLLGCFSAQSAVMDTYPNLGTPATTSDFIHGWDDSSTLGPANILFSGDATEFLSGTGTWVDRFTYDYIQFTPSTAPSYVEGKVYYDSGKNALSYYNDEADVTVNIGQEIMFQAYNDGAEIPNGSLVTPDGGVHSGTGLPTMVLADASLKSKSRFVGMATHTIEAGSSGWITRLGSVGGLNTVGLTGILYLSADTPGDYTLTPPDDGAYAIQIGAPGVIDAVNGTIIMDPYITHLTVEVTDTNGFSPAQRAATTMSFSDSSPDRTFTIAPTGSDFHYYILGDKYEITGSETVQIDDTEGLHVIYYDETTGLTAVANPTEAQQAVVIRTKCIVAYVYWDDNSSVSTYFAEERHGIAMSPDTHAWIHFNMGAQYSSGLALGDFSTDDVSPDSTSAQFSVASGAIIDEDLYSTPDAVASTVGLPIYYIDGSGSDLRRTTQTNFAIKAGSGTGNPLWNEFTGGAWTTTEVTNNNYILYHIFVINGYEGSDQTISVMGQASYNTVALARAGASTEISNIVLGFPFEESVPIGTIIIQGNTSYGNDVNARIRADGDGNDYADWRTTELAAGVAASDHNNLTGLDLAQDTIAWGHIDDQAQSIYGVKTYNAFSITPSSAPTTDYQTVNKKYVDDNFETADAAITKSDEAETLTANWVNTANPWVVNEGGTGAATLTDGGVLLGSGTGAITPMAVLADSEMIVGDGTTDPVAESGATLRTSIGLGTAAVRDAEDTLTDGANLPDGAAIKAYGDANWAGGGGDVTKVGTPVNNQVGIWTGDGTLEGSANLTHDGTDTVAGGDFSALTYSTSAVDGNRFQTYPDNPTTEPTASEVADGLYNYLNRLYLVENDLKVGSIGINIEPVGWTIIDSDTVTAVADGKQAFVVPAYMNGWDLTAVTASIYDLNSATGGTTTIVIRRVRGATPVDMLSTGVTITYTDYTASDGVINTSNDDLATGDLIYVDVNAVTTGAAQKGLSVTCMFKET